MTGRTARRALRWGAAAAVAYAGSRALRRSSGADLTGRVVLITGGSRGLGLVLARTFAREGCRIAICARDTLELERARADLAGRGADVLALPCDVSDPVAVSGWVERVAAHFGAVDVLVNNASIIQVGPLETMTLDDFQRVMGVNFWGCVHATLAVLPHMRTRGGGRIVNIASIGGKVAIPHLLPYDCAKFGVVGFSQGLRAELAVVGITVTTIIPGLMRTGSPVNALFKGDAGREFAWFSLGDALPFSSMSAERAARRIVEATRRGEAEVTLSWQARLLGLAHDLFPGTAANVLGWANRALPDAAGQGTGETRGMHLAGSLSPSPLTTLMNRAALRFNQYGGQPTPTAEHARKVGLSSPEPNA